MTKPPTNKQDDEMWDAQLGLFRHKAHTACYDFTRDDLVEVSGQESSTTAPQVPAERPDAVAGAAAQTLLAPCTPVHEERADAADVLSCVDPAHWDDAAEADDPTPTQQVPTHGPQDPERALRRRVVKAGRENGYTQEWALETLQELVRDSGNTASTLRRMMELLQDGRSLDELVHAHQLRQCWSEYVSEGHNVSRDETLSWACALRLMDRLWDGDWAEVTSVLKMAARMWSEDRERNHRWYGTTQLCDAETVGRPNYNLLCAYVEEVLEMCPEELHGVEWLDALESSTYGDPLYTRHHTGHSTRPDDHVALEARWDLHPLRW